MQFCQNFLASLISPSSAPSQQHPVDLLDRNAEVAQQLDLSENPDILLAVFAVSVFCVSSGRDHPLFFVKADIFLRDSRQRLNLFDFHRFHPPFCMQYIPSTWGKVNRISKLFPFFVQFI